MEFCSSISLSNSNKSFRQHNCFLSFLTMAYGSYVYSKSLQNTSLFLQKDRLGCELLICTSLPTHKSRVLGAVQAVVIFVMKAQQRQMEIYFNEFTVSTLFLFFFNW